MDRFNVTERRSLLIRCSVTAGLLFICAFGAYAQAVTFPTDGNCSTELTPLPTAGGAVYFSGGAFIDCNGTPTLVTCYATGISMLFAPAASSVQFSIRNFFPFNEEISVDAPTGDNGGALPKLGSGGLTTTIQADQQGRFETTLIVNSRTAGDNYQLVGSTNENFDCGARSCPRSAIFTLWKRVYVEEEHMFRRGSFITTRTAMGASEIPIEDPTPFRNLAVGAALRVLHADTDGSGFYAETVRLRAVVQGRSGAWNLLIDANG